MNEWILYHALRLAIVTFLAGVLGWLIGNHWQSGAAGTLVGSTIAATCLGLRDRWKTQHFMRWLRGDQTDRAPRDSGFWGEIAYRVERSFRQRERRIQIEQNRLTQFLSAIEASPNGVMMLDEQDHIEWCNQVSASHFGLDPRRDRLQRVTNLVRFPAFVAYLQSQQYDQPVHVPLQRDRLTLQIFIRLYGEGRKLVLSRDVTERERHEAMQRDFVANVSHEIRTPLTVVSGFIETLDSLPLDEKERHRILQLMMKQTSRMRLLVEDLLTLAKLEGKPRPGPNESVELGQLLHTIKQEAQLLSAGQHQLVFDPLPVQRIIGSAAELHSAVTNLVNNAIRYTPPGKIIRVQWHLRADGLGELRVTDNGPGIPKEHLLRLCERFYRVDGSRSRDTGGTGLGLSIVKHVMERHGGELKIDSEIGSGSSFKLIFPAARLQEQNLSHAGTTAHSVHGTWQ
jgi:two-component system, OmpR family, phosphate regulon sensor histidine kinase PhoR